jgi:hypothetical protein
VRQRHRKELIHGLIELAGGRESIIQRLVHNKVFAVTNERFVSIEHQNSPTLMPSKQGIARRSGKW